MAGGHQSRQLRQTILEPGSDDDADPVLREGMDVGIEQPRTVEQADDQVSVSRTHSLHGQIGEFEGQVGMAPFKVAQPRNQPLHGQAVVDGDGDAGAHTHATDGLAERIKTRREPREQFAACGGQVKT